MRASVRPRPTPWWVRVLSSSRLFERFEDAVERVRRRCRGRGRSRAPGDAAFGRDPDRDASCSGREREAVLDELLEDATRRDPVEAGHRRPGAASTMTRSCIAATSRATWVTSAHSVSPASTAASNRCTSRARLWARSTRLSSDLSAFLDRGGALRQRLGHAQDHGDRGAELVTEPRDQLVAPGAPFQQRLLGDLQLAGPASFALEGFGEALDHRGRDLGGDHAATDRGLADRRG